jgi:hypothetical protein
MKFINVLQKSIMNTLQCDNLIHSNISNNYFKHLTILLKKFISSEGRTLFYAKNLLPFIEEQIEKLK